MSRLYMGGAEIDIGNGPASTPDNDSHGGSNITRDTTIFRSGSASWKCDSQAGNFAAPVTFSGTALGTAPRDYFARVYFYFVDLPGTTATIMYLGNPGDINLRMNSDGTLRLWQNGSMVGATPSDPLQLNTWYQLEVMASLDASALFTAAGYKINDVLIDSITGLSFARSNTAFAAGWITAPGASKVLYMDDVALNNNIDPGNGSNTSWCESGRVILMRPTSDQQRGTWTGGVGGTTNLFDAINNTPPIGTNAESDTTQIESTDSSGDNTTDEYVGDCGSYINAGLASQDVVKAIKAWVNHGEDVNTNTKTGSFALKSNPAASYTPFTYGNDGGALGAYPTGWVWAGATIENQPSVTLSSALQLAVRKTDTGTRVASVDFLGAYVDYLPVISPLKIPSIVPPVPVQMRSRL